MSGGMHICCLRATRTFDFIPRRPWNHYRVVRYVFVYFSKIYTDRFGRLIFTHVTVSWNVAHVRSVATSCARRRKLTKAAPIVFSKIRQIEVHVAVERVRSEKKAEQDRALADIQEEENRARERCKVSSRALTLRYLTLQNTRARGIHGKH